MLSVRTALVAIALACAGCGQGRAYQQACQADCQREHDGCMLAAANAGEIQTCDDRMSACVRYCR